MDERGIYPQPMSRNYFNSANDSYMGFRERIDGTEVIVEICNELRGVSFDEHGNLKEYPEYRMLNEKGIARVRALLKSIMNKVNHLTKYENNARVLMQIKSTVSGFLPELVLNLRDWAPEGELKVRNWPLILRMIENGVVASMLRGEGGFEAKNLTQQHSITELVDGRPRPKKGLFGMFGGQE